MTHSGRFTPENPEQRVTLSLQSRPAYGQEQCGGLTPDDAAKILRADAGARRSLNGNGNLRLNVAVLAGEIT